MGKGGKLMFKGEKKKKSKSKHKKKDDADPTVEAIEPETSNVAAAATPRAASKASNATTAPTIQNGTGKVTSSGTVLTGTGTIFEKQVSVGDAILVKLPQSGKQEMRVITMRLSNTSLNLSSAFTESLKSATSFQYVPKPRNIENERKLEAKKRQQYKDQEERHAFGTYSSNQTLVYREKTETGSYRIRKEKVNDDKSRGELLSLRSKKMSDKYC